MKHAGLRSFVGALVVVGILAAGGIAYASHRFNDVPDSNIFHDDIDFLASRGVTLGCGGGNYCPKSAVTREQMAAFIRRFAEATSPVVVARRTNETLTSGATVCVTDPHMAPFEQLVTLTGGLYQQGTPNGDTDNLSARLRVRVDGGSWTDVSGAWSMPASPGTGSTGYANTTTTGYVALEAGSSYEFALRVRGELTDRGDDGCQLLGIVQHRMPGAAAALTPAGGGGTETNSGG